MELHVLYSQIAFSQAIQQHIPISQARLIIGHSSVKKELMGLTKKKHFKTQDQKPPNSLVRNSISEHTTLSY